MFGVWTKNRHGKCPQLEFRVVLCVLFSLVHAPESWTSSLFVVSIEASCNDFTLCAGWSDQNWAVTSCLLPGKRNYVAMWSRRLQHGIPHDLSRPSLLEKRTVRVGACTRGMSWWRTHFFLGTTGRRQTRQSSGEYPEIKGERRNLYMWKECPWYMLCRCRHFRC